MTDPAPRNDPASAPLRVLAGSPTAEELAAVAAVLAQLVIERDAVTVELEPEQRGSAWARSTRHLRGGATARPAWSDPVL